MKVTNERGPSKTTAKPIFTKGTVETCAPYCGLKVTTVSFNLKDPGDYLRGNISVSDVRVVPTSEPRYVRAWVEIEKKPPSSRTHSGTNTHRVLCLRGVSVIGPELTHESLNSLAHSLLQRSLGQGV